MNTIQINIWIIYQIAICITELFIKGRKLNIYLDSIALSYCAVTKKFRLNSTNCFIMKIQNKRDLQQIGINLPSDLTLTIF